MPGLSHAEKGLAPVMRHWIRNSRFLPGLQIRSKTLASAVAQEVAWQPGQFVVELGAGCGAVTQALIDRGIPANKILALEIKGSNASYLMDRFSSCRVVQCDAIRLSEIVVREGIENISTIISALPLYRHTLAYQQKIVLTSLELMRGQGSFLQHSWLPFSPVRHDQMGIQARLLRYVYRSIPPSAIWSYTQRQTSQ